MLKTVKIDPHSFAQRVNPSNQVPNFHTWELPSRVEIRLPSGELLHLHEYGVIELIWMAYDLFLKQNDLVELPYYRMWWLENAVVEW